MAEDAFGRYIPETELDPTGSGPIDTYRTVGVEFGDDDDPQYVNLSNPGLTDLPTANPELYRELYGRRAIRDRFRDFADQYLDPQRYAERRDDLLQRADVQNMNRFSRMGLAGTSAAAGAGNESMRQIEFGMQDRAISDQMRLLQMENLLTGNIEKDILAIQTQYDNYQKAYMNMLLGAEHSNQAAEAADRAMWGQILSAVGATGGAIAGGMAGGPSGAFMGANAGSNLGSFVPGQTPPGAFSYNEGQFVPESYNSPHFGPVGGGVGDGYYDGLSGYADGYF